jgi:SAM-dependent methyltransferase
MAREPDWDDWAKYYDAVDADRSPFIEFYGSLVSDKIHSILEIACGTGRITSALASRLVQQHGSLRFSRIVGIDESLEMLRIAKARDDRVAWVCGDMRTLILDDPFDLVICCYNTLQQMLSDDDALQALRVVRSLLAPEGIFAFDIYQPNSEYLNRPASNRLARTVVDERGRHLEIRENVGYEPETRVLTIDWRLLEDGQNPPLARTRYKYRQYDTKQIEWLLDKAGLVIWERYGDFNRSPLTAMAKKQVVVCRPI